MKLLKNKPVKENSYLNIKVSAFEMDFSFFDILLHDFSKYKYCIAFNDGNQEIVAEFSKDIDDVLKKWDYFWEMALLRSRQIYDVKARKFKYPKYNDDMKQTESKLQETKNIETIEKKETPKIETIQKEEVKQEIQIEKQELVKDEKVNVDVKSTTKISPDGTPIVKENVDGLFYVDEKCIGCEACISVAPDFFAVGESYAYIKLQPKTSEEIKLCQQALEECPSACIYKNE